MELTKFYDEAFLAKIGLKDPDGPWIDPANWKYLKILEALGQAKKDLTRICEELKKNERQAARLAKRAAKPVLREREGKLPDGKAPGSKKGRGRPRSILL